MPDKVIRYGHTDSLGDDCNIRSRELSRSIADLKPTFKRKHILPKYFKNSISLRSTATCFYPLSGEFSDDCYHQCIYCYARNKIHQLKAVWWDGDVSRIRLSDIEDMKRKFTYSLDSNNNYLVGAPLAIKRRMPLRLCVMTDPFQPLERNIGIAYSFLKFLNDFDYPIIISTKGNTILLQKYVKLLTDMKNVVIQVSLPTHNKHISTLLEPYAGTPEQRLRIIKTYSQHGIRTVGRVFPVIPNITKSTAIDTIGLLIDSGADLIHTAPYYMDCNTAINKLFINRFNIDMLKYYRLKFKGAKGVYSENKLTFLDYATRAIQYSMARGVDIIIDDNSLFMLSTTTNKCCGTGYLPLSKQKELGGFSECNTMSIRSWLDHIKRYGNLNIKTAITGKALSDRHESQALANYDVLDGFWGIRKYGEDRDGFNKYELDKADELFVSAMELCGNGI